MKVMTMEVISFQTKPFSLTTVRLWFGHACNESADTLYSWINAHIATSSFSMSLLTLHTTMPNSGKKSFMISPVLGICKTKMGKMDATLTNHHCILSEGYYPTWHKPAPKSPKLLSIALYIAVEISSFRTWDPNGVGDWKVRSMQDPREYKQHRYACEWITVLIAFVMFLLKPWPRCTGIKNWMISPELGGLHSYKFAQSEPKLTFSAMDVGLTRTTRYLLRWRTLQTRKAGSMYVYMVLSVTIAHHHKYHLTHS